MTMGFTTISCKKTSSLALSGYSNVCSFTSNPFNDTSSTLNQSTLDDPEFPDSKASYRDFLTTSSHFRQPIPFNDETIRRKIHQTHRLQFLKDVVLARVLDDPTFNVLNSFILFNLIDILNHIQHDEPWLRELFSVFEDDWEAKQKQKLAGEGGDKVKEEDAAAAGKNEDEKKERASSPDKGKEKAKAEDDPDSTSQSSQSPTSLRTEALLLIHQLCQMSKSVQIPARLALCRTLVDRGVLKAIEWAFGQDDPATMNAAGEILLVIVDHDITGVRGFVMGEAEKEKEKEGGGEPKGLIWALIKLLGGRKDLAFKSQMADLLRMLLELEGGPGEVTPSSLDHSTDSDSDFY
jgi:protein phosphatase-4 regulatory subunit 3